ncbi:MAG: Vault protein inter-alpha-trypsin [Euryarchaeota archaeon ADurb.BinA087]|nr:MAG: Vault protein inter-alpha-trypsin [Euryarchaeota archaeon ADurb.BinA087]
MAINAIFYENCVPKGTGILEITGADGPSGLFIPLRATTINGTFHGPLGSLTLTQTFRFARQALDHPIEAIYRFPLPGDAAVTEVVAVFGDETIRTRLTERGKAEREYDEAFKKGKKAVLVTRESPDVFTLHLTGIPPETDVVVRTTFTVLARAVPGGWEVRLPVTIAPRYVRRDESHTGVQANPLLSVTDPLYRISLDLMVQPAAEMTMVPQGAIVTRTREETWIRIDSSRPNHDLLFRWTHTTGEKWLTTWAANDPEGSFTYLLSLITPPGGKPSDRIPREVILVADQSGSMQGGKWNAAAQSIMAFLDGLLPDEVFNLCLFSNQALWFSAKGPVPATKDRIEAAKRFLQTTSLFGGTELGVALEQALRQPRLPGTYARHLLVITDGQVTDEARLFRLVETEAAHPSSRRVSVISIDTAPNSHLALELARVGGGVAKFLTSEEEVEPVLRELLLSWQPPIVSNASLAADQPGLEVNDSRVLASGAIDIGDLRPEMPLFLCSRIPCSPSPPALTLAKREGEIIEIATAHSGECDLGTSAKVLFGAGRLRILEYLLNARYPDEELVQRLERAGYPVPTLDTTVYPENRSQALYEYLDQLIIGESLRYGIPSSRTAFVGVSQKEGTVPPVTVAVPNALPEGWIYQKGSAPVLMECIDMIMQPDVKMSMRRSADMRMSVRKSISPSVPLVSLPMNLVIPALEVKDGTAVLVESSGVAKGSYTLFLTFTQRMKPAGVSLRVEIDGKSVMTWSDAKLRAGDSRIMIPVHVSSPGRLQVFVVDPSGAWNGLHISVSLRKEEGVMWV